MYILKMLENIQWYSKTGMERLNQLHICLLYYLSKRIFNFTSLITKNYFKNIFNIF